jgi:hypothetical protein
VLPAAGVDSAIGHPHHRIPNHALRHALRPTKANALSQVATEELLLELRRRITAPRDTRHESWDDWDGGLDPHGDWPEQGEQHPGRRRLPSA